MQLTPEQQMQVDQAKVAGNKRAMLTMTPQQRTDWQAAVEEELAGRNENVQHFRKIKAAAAQEGFLGDLRRAIVLSRTPIRELSVEIGVDERLFSDFRAGDAELSSVILDRLVAALGLRLMQEIPR